MSSKQTTLLIAYLAHLTIPLFLLLDEWGAWRAFQFDRADKLVVVVTILWLGAGLSALLLSRHRDAFLRRTAKPLLMFYSICVTLAVAEIGYRFLPAPKRNTPGVYPPGLKDVQVNDLSVMPGVSRIAHYTVDDIGLRGPDWPRDPRAYKIITVGGSTTECAALDDSEEWPHLLMEQMNAGQKKRSVWVGNAGVAGHTAVHHLAFVKEMPILRKADLLIFLMGINDLQATLSAEGRSTQHFLEEDAESIMVRSQPLPPPGIAHFRRLWLFQLAMEAFTPLLRRIEGVTLQPDFGGSFLLKVRQLRAALPIVPLPDLRTGLDEYAHRIRAIEAECRARQIRCVFLTQPSMDRPDLSDYEKSLISFGWVGPFERPKGFVSVSDMIRATDAYNQTLLSVCHADGLECYDLASNVPQNTSAFLDEFHYNISGAQRVAKFLANRLLAAPPFAD